MNVLNKLVSALRGSLHDAGEALIDSQALRILDQELRDASEELAQTRASLAALMAEHKLSQEKHTTLLSSIREQEDYAVQALALPDQTLARDLAIRITELESQARAEKERTKILGNSVDKLRQAAESAGRELQILKQQVSTLKANESVNRAQAVVSARHSGGESRLQTAKDSLARLEKRQQMESATRAAAHEIDQQANPGTCDEQLDRRLKEAGIKPNPDSADAVLDRLRKKTQQ